MWDNQKSTGVAGRVEFEINVAGGNPVILVVRAGDTLNVLLPADVSTAAKVIDSLGLLGQGLNDRRDTTFQVEFANGADGIFISSLIPDPIPGDYNADQIVNAADYTLWRNTLGSTTDLRADGDGSGTVDAGDYAFWRERYGDTAGSGSGEVVGVPEPATALLTLLFLTLSLNRQRRLAERGKLCHRSDGF